VHAQGSLAWQHGFGGVHSLAALSFNAGSTPFVVEGTALSKDAAALTLALVWDVNAAFQLSLAYDGLIGNSGDSHNGRATASFRF
jgi:subtilase-type serine protease